MRSCIRARQREITGRPGRYQDIVQIVNPAFRHGFEKARIVAQHLLGARGIFGGKGRLRSRDLAPGFHPAAGQVGNAFERPVLPIVVNYGERLAGAARPLKTASFGGSWSDNMLKRASPGMRPESRKILAASRISSALSGASGDGAGAVDWHSATPTVSRIGRASRIFPL